MIGDIINKKPCFVNGSGKSSSFVSSIEKMKSLLCSQKVDIHNGIEYFIELQKNK